MSCNPAQLIATLLQTNDTGSGDTSIVAGEGVGVGWRLFRDTEPDSPDTTVTVYNTVGSRPNPKFLLDFPAVQIRVRGSAVGQDLAYDEIYAVKQKLLGIQARDLTYGAETHRVDSITMAVDINFLGRDTNDRPRYTLTLNMIVEPGATAADHRTAL